MRLQYMMFVRFFFFASFLGSYVCLFVGFSLILRKGMVNRKACDGPCYIKRKKDYEAREKN